MRKFLIVIVGFFISSNLIAANFSVEHKKEAEKFITIMNYKGTGVTMKKNMMKIYPNYYPQNYPT